MDRNLVYAQKFCVCTRILRMYKDPVHAQDSCARQKSCACTRILCMHRILAHTQDSCACTGFLCMHRSLVHAHACARFLCMHKILVHASGGLKTTIISMCLRLLPRSVYKNCVFYQRNDGWPSPSTAHAHKTCSGDHKNGNRDRSGKWAVACTGYRNIVGAPQAFAIWGVIRARQFVVKCV